MRKPLCIHKVRNIKILPPWRRPREPNSVRNLRLRIPERSWAMGQIVRRADRRAPVLHMTLQKKAPVDDLTQQANARCGGTFLAAIGLGTAVLRTGSLRDSE